MIRKTLLLRRRIPRQIYCIIITGISTCCITQVHSLVSLVSDTFLNSLAWWVCKCFLQFVALMVVSHLQPQRMQTAYFVFVNLSYFGLHSFQIGERFNRSLWPDPDLWKMYEKQRLITFFLLQYPYIIFCNYQFPLH